VLAAEPPQNVVATRPSGGRNAPTAHAHGGRVGCIACVRTGWSHCLGHWSRWPGRRQPSVCCASREARNARTATEEREWSIDSLLVRIHCIIVMIRWTGLAPAHASMEGGNRVRAKRGHMDTCQGRATEKHGQNLALTIVDERQGQNQAPTVS
jgi:hypothetical protein